MRSTATIPQVLICDCCNLPFNWTYDSMNNTDLPDHLRLNVIVNTVVGNNPIDHATDLATWIKAGLKQIDLIIDEANELKAGIDDFTNGGDLKKAASLVEIRDGVADVIVTLDGLVHRLALPFPVDLTAGEPAPSSMLEVEFLMDRLEKIRDAIEHIDGVNVLPDKLDALVAEAYAATYRIAEAYKIDVAVDQVAVYESNMSKFDLDKQTALAGVEKYSRMGVSVAIHEIPTEEDGETFTYYVLKSDQDQVVDGKSYPSGKFLKGLNYKDPVFAPLD